MSATDELSIRKLENALKLIDSYDRSVEDNASVNARYAEVDAKYNAMEIKYNELVSRLASVESANIKTKGVYDGLVSRVEDINEWIRRGKQ